MIEVEHLNSHPLDERAVRADLWVHEHLSTLNTPTLWEVIHAPTDENDKWTVLRTPSRLNLPKATPKLITTPTPEKPDKRWLAALD